MKVGEIYSSKGWGDMEIVGIGKRARKNGHSSHSTVTVRFALTGNIRETNSNQVSLGCVEDTESRLAGNCRTDGTKNNLMVVGQVLKSNLWGDVEVVAVVSTKEVHVVFLDSGNAGVFQAAALVAGLVRDSKAQYVEKYWRDKHLREGNAAIRQAVKWLTLPTPPTKGQLDKIERDRLHQELEQSLKSKTYAHDYFGEYHIITVAKDGKKCTVKFLNTGNIVNTTTAKATSGQTLDLDSFDGDWAKEQSRAKSAAHYTANRERLLTRQIAYQKANPQKAREANVRHRAAKAASEGSHTKAELEVLYNEQGGLCNSCGTSLECGRDLDHILPTALGGSNYISNIQWLCPFCNNCKGAKHPDDWAKHILTPAFQKRREIHQDMSYVSYA